MTTTARPASATGQRQRRREAALGRPTPSRAPVRRRWGRIGAGIGAAIFGAWLFAALYLSADDRREVLAMANDVARYEVVERTDLRQVRVSEDSDLASVASGDIDRIVGRVARTDLVVGALLADDQLMPEGTALLAADEAVVGVLIGPGDGPVQTLRRGTPVLVVVRPAVGDASERVEVDGWVYDSSGEPLNARERPVELAVPRDQAALISAAAADQRVTIVALSG